jgi:hypothetical protein
MRRLPLVLLLACGLVACSKDSNRLYGSVSDVNGYSLGFDRVQIFRIGGQVSIEYQQTSGSTIKAKTAKLTVTVGDLANIAGNDISLTELVGGLPRGTMQRIGETSTTDFPLQTGLVHFNQEPTAGTELGGSFHTTLDNPAGRTLNGDFEATVVAP